MKRRTARSAQDVSADGARDLTVREVASTDRGHVAAAVARSWREQLAELPLATVEELKRVLTYAMDALGSVGVGRKRD